MHAQCRVGDRKSSTHVGSMCDSTKWVGVCVPQSRRRMEYPRFNTSESRGGSVGSVDTTVGIKCGFFSSTSRATFM